MTVQKRLGKKHVAFDDSIIWNAEHRSSCTDDLPVERVRVEFTEILQSMNVCIVFVLWRLASTVQVHRNEQHKMHLLCSAISVGWVCVHRCILLKQAITNRYFVF